MHCYLAANRFIVEAAVVVVVRIIGWVGTGIGGHFKADVDQTRVVAHAQAELVENGDHLRLDGVRVMRGAVVEQREHGLAQLRLSEQIGTLVHLHGGDERVVVRQLLALQLEQVLRIAERPQKHRLEQIVTQRVFPNVTIRARQRQEPRRVGAMGLLLLLLDAFAVLLALLMLTECGVAELVDENVDHLSEVTLDRVNVVVADQVLVEDDEHLAPVVLEHLVGDHRLRQCGERRRGGSAGDRGSRDARHRSLHLAQKHRFFLFVLLIDHLCSTDSI